MLLEVCVFVGVYIYVVVCMYMYTCVVYVLVSALLILYIFFSLQIVGGIHPMFAAGSRQQIAT